MKDPFYDPTSGIGQVRTATAVANTTTALGTFIDATNVASLDVGVWLVIATGSGAFNNSPDTGVITPYAALIDETSAELAVQNDQATFGSTLAAGNSSFFTWQIGAIVTAVTPKTLKVRLKSVAASGAPTTGGIGSRSSATGIQAVRIANIFA